MSFNTASDGELLLRERKKNALHDAGKTFAFCHAYTVNVLTDYKMLYIEFGADI
jgi:hypothetical protein